MEVKINKSTKRETMKLTKLQRHTAYIIMLREAELFYDFDNDYGLCKMSYDVLGLYTYCYGHKNWIYNISNYLPELWAKRLTDSVYSSWFTKDKKGWDERIKILKQCVKETYE